MNYGGAGGSWDGQRPGAQGNLQTNAPPTRPPSSASVYQPNSFSVLPLQRSTPTPAYNQPLHGSCNYPPNTAHNQGGGQPYEAQHFAHPTLPPGAQGGLPSGPYAPQVHPNHPPQMINRGGPASTSYPHQPPRAHSASPFPHPAHCLPVVPSHRASYGGPPYHQGPPHPAPPPSTFAPSAPQHRPPPASYDYLEDDLPEDALQFLAAAAGSPPRPQHAAAPPPQGTTPAPAPPPVQGPEAHAGATTAPPSVPNTGQDRPEATPMSQRPPPSYVDCTPLSAPQDDGAWQFYGAATPGLPPGPAPARHSLEDFSQLPTSAEGKAIEFTGVKAEEGDEAGPAGKKLRVHPPSPVYVKKIVLEDDSAEKAPPSDPSPVTEEDKPRALQLHPMRGEGAVTAVTAVTAVQPAAPLVIPTPPNLKPDAPKPTKIQGLEVYFPYNPYGVQISMMNMVLMALNKGANGLYEVPTGCGKTASMLCSVLAWQWGLKHRTGGVAPQVPGRKKSSGGAEEGVPGRPGFPLPEAGGFLRDAPAAPPSFAINPDMLDPRTVRGTGANGVGAQGQGKREAAGKKVRVFYATRTHSQVAQVVRELKKTAYKPKMAILGSREQYCIHPEVSKARAKDQECDARIQEMKRAGVLNGGEFAGRGAGPKGCHFFLGVPQMVRFSEVHDIEDLCNEGRLRRACPYYMSKNLAEHAEFVLCPYNYLLDPIIREAMGTDLEDSVVIFDEAHNLEDVCRESVSVDLELPVLEATWRAWGDAAQAGGGAVERYKLVEEALKRLLEFLREYEAQAPPHGPPQPGSGERISSGARMLEDLTRCGLGPLDLPSLREAFLKVKAAEERATSGGEGGGKGRRKRRRGRGEGGEEEEEGGLGQEDGEEGEVVARVGAPALRTTDSLLTILRLLYGSATGSPSALHLPDRTDDYSLVLHWERASAQANAAAALAPGAPLAAAWGGRKKGKAARGNQARRADDPRTVVFSLWCLNPAVAMSELQSRCWSVLLASGTLSPLTSFASELGMAFEVRQEANHVIDVKSQVFAASVALAPDGTVLNSVYKNVDLPSYQDALGEALYEISRRSPSGVLVVLPSYAMLEKLSNRWRLSGLLQRLQEHKEVYYEPRGGTREAAGQGEDMDGVIKGFFSANDRSLTEGRGGGLLMAVCRGKVSEGIDFADHHARTVVLIGVPFPNVKDPKVNLKKAYNNNGARTKGLLSGDLWYTQQAFRSLNQALGRCIRHRHDYGAVILLDERYNQPRFIESLSKWVRAAVKPHPSFGHAMGELEAFFAHLSDHPPGGHVPTPKGPQPEAPQLNPAMAALFPGDRWKSKAGASGAGPGKPAAPALPAPEPPLLLQTKLYESLGRLQQGLEAGGPEGWRAAAAPLVATWAPREVERRAAFLRGEGAEGWRRLLEGMDVGPGEEEGARRAAAARDLSLAFEDLLARFQADQSRVPDPQDAPPGPSQVDLFWAAQRLPPPRGLLLIARAARLTPDPQSLRSDYPLALEEPGDALEGEEALGSLVERALGAALPLTLEPNLQAMRELYETTLGTAGKAAGAGAAAGQPPGEPRVVQRAPPREITPSQGASEPHLAQAPPSAPQALPSDSSEGVVVVNAGALVSEDPLSEGARLLARALRKTAAEETPRGQAPRRAPLSDLPGVNRGPGAVFGSGSGSGGSKSELAMAMELSVPLGMLLSGGSRRRRGRRPTEIVTSQSDEEA